MSPRSTDSGKWEYPYHRAFDILSVTGPAAVIRSVETLG